MERWQHVHEGQLALLQMEKPKALLRFQNIPECKEENLKEVMSALLAPLVQMMKKDFLSEIELTYRTNSMYIKKNGLPRKVFMIFSTKRMKDLILQKSSSQASVKDQVIKVFKDIPFTIRQKRKLYQQLSNLSIKKNIKFRWLTREDFPLVLKGAISK